MRPIYQRMFKTFIREAFRPWKHAGYGIKDAWQLRCGNDSLSVFFVTRSVILREDYNTPKEITTTGVWDRYSFRLNPETRVIAIDDADGSGQVSVKLLPKDLGRFMKALRMDETDS